MGLLYRNGTREIWILSNTAAIIWCLSMEGRNHKEISAIISSEFSVESETAKKDVGQTLVYFKEQNLLENHAVSAGKKLRSKDETVPPQPIDTQNVKGQTSNTLPKYPFQLLNTAYTVSTDDAAIINTLKSIWPGQTGTPSPPGNACRITVQTFPQTGTIYVDEQLYLSNCEQGRIVTVIMRIVFNRACQNLSNKLLLHSGVIAGPSSAVILPGNSGSGKSTLTATLAAKGWIYFSDEIAVIDNHNQRVSSFPMPLTIKDGSVEPLRQLHPTLPNLQSFRRADNKIVRYMTLDPKNIAAQELLLPIKNVIFPNYNREAPCQLTPISKEEALVKIVETCSSDRDLLPQDIQSLIQIILGAHCSSLIFSDLNQAVSLVKKQHIDNN